MNYPIGTGSQTLGYPEYPDDFHQRMEAAYGTLSRLYYFILVGSHIATDKQRAAASRIEKKLLYLARYV